MLLVYPFQSALPTTYYIFCNSESESLIIFLDDQAVPRKIPGSYFPRSNRYRPSVWDHFPRNWLDAGNTFVAGTWAITLCNVYSGFFFKTQKCVLRSAIYHGSHTREFCFDTDSCMGDSPDFTEHSGHPDWSGVGSACTLHRLVHNFYAAWRR